MSNSTGLYQRPDSPYWWANWTDASGQALRRSTRIAVADDPRGTQAMAVRERFMQPAAAPVAVPMASADEGGTWDELMELYLEHLAVQCRRSTLRRYESAIRQLYPAFTGRLVDSITRKQVKAYLRERRATCQAATVNVEVSLMFSAFAWARDELEWEIDNPWAGRGMAVNPPRTRWLTRDECDRLIAAAGLVRSPYLSDYIRIALNTGMRPGELLGLQWDRVDLDAGRILFRPEDSKNGRAASIPINATARLALLSRQAAQRERRCITPWVISLRNGGRVMTIHDALARAATVAGVADVHPHDLRRTFASHLVQAGVSIQTVSGLLRHADIAVTHRVYAHLSPEQFRGATAVLDAPPQLRAVQ